MKGLTGTTAFRSFLLGIPAQVDEFGPFEMVFPATPKRHQIMLLEAMGVPVVIDEKLPAPVVRRKRPDR